MLFLMVLGHLWGDYLLQNNFMALNKTKSSLICFLHSLLYTLTICLFMNKWSMLFFLMIFLTHYPIDRYSLGQKWLDLIKGRNFMNEYNDNSLYKEIRVSFSTLVYAVVDNTLHLTLMYFVTTLWFFNK